MKIKRICLSIIFALMGLMVLVGCQLEPAAPVPTPTPSDAIELHAAADNGLPGICADEIYTVSTVDELLAAIGPDRIIELRDGEYDLSAATGYGTDSSDYWYWNPCYDGWELVINDVENMHFSAEEHKLPQIVTQPRYANVLRFENCDTVSISSLIIGHIEERGSCSGGVLYFDNCQDMSTGFCRLYGCGTIGITAINCSGVYALESYIYDCSQSAVFASACHDVRVLNSRIHDNGTDWSQGLFHAEGCNGFAVVNCDIYDNFAANFMYSRYSQQLNVLGCTVRENSFSDYLFHCDGYSPCVEKCRFDANGDISAFAALPAVDAQGNELSEADIEGMVYAQAYFTGPKEAAPVALDEHENAQGLREVSVKTVDEFLAAIASDTVIKLEAELFDLSAAADFGAYGNENYYWINVYDGPALVINGVENLSIVAENDCSIAAIPRYADVIKFLNCESIRLSGFTAGHTQEPGACVGGVLSFENCWDVGIDNCRLYGCGILGINASYCSELNVTNTEIYDCSLGAIALYTVMDASFDRMDIHDCASPEISITDSMNISYEGAAIKNGDYRLDDNQPQYVIY